MRKKGILLGILFACTMLFCASCKEKSFHGINDGNSNAQGTQQDNEDTINGTEGTGDEARAQSQYEMQYQSQQVKDILKEKWSRQEKIENANVFMSLSEYQRNIFKDHEKEKAYYRGTVVDGKNMYFMRVYYLEEEDGKMTPVYYLDILDADTLDVKTIQYKVDYYICNDIIVSGGRVMNFFDERDEEGYLTRFSAVELLPDGTVSEPMEILPLLDMAGVSQVESYYAVTMEACWNASAGQIFVLSADATKIYWYDMANMEIKSFEGFGGEKEIFSYLGNTVDGIPLFQCKDTIKKTASIFCFHEEEAEIIYEGEELFCQNMITDSYGNITYRTGDGLSLVNWNVSTGEEERLFYGRKETYQNMQGMLRNAKGEIVMVSTSDNYLRIFSMKGPAKKVAITVQPDVYATPDFKNYIHLYEDTHPGITFDILPEYEWSEKEAAVNKVFAQMAKGEGPDIMLFDDSDLVNYADKDCLMQLDAVFSLGDNIPLLPQVLKAGQLEGKQYAIYSEFNLSSVLVNSDYWDNPTWTAKELMQVIEKKEQTGEPFQWLLLGEVGEPLNPIDLFVYCIDQSEFVDSQTGRCRFNSEEFINILKMCKKYYLRGKEMTIPSQEVNEALLDGRALARTRWMLNLSTFSSDMAEMKSKGNFVGFATNGESGNILRGSNGIMVNKNTENFEVINDFLHELYTFDYLGTGYSSIPFRKDLYTDRIRTAKDDGFDWLTGPAVVLDGHSVWPMAGKPDGSSYLSEYMEVVDCCEVPDWRMQPIRVIIWEETQAYYESERTAEETAKIIQSRASLYLAENQ